MGAGGTGGGGGGGAPALGWRTKGGPNARGAPPGLEYGGPPPPP
eukprot:SAG11_NODE_4470_length_1884_cov_2.234734_1_plen_43_part_10